MDVETSDMEMETRTWRHGHGDVDMETRTWRHGHENGYEQTYVIQGKESEKILNSVHGIPQTFLLGILRKFGSTGKKFRPNSLDTLSPSLKNFQKISWIMELRVNQSCYFLPKKYMRIPGNHRWASLTLNLAS
jgi:hypothetical protein